MQKYFDYAAHIREELHAIPEIGFDLPKTIAVVHRELDKLGLSYTDKWGRSSVVGYVGAEDAPFTIGLRADMDALPIQEDNDLPYKSTHDGIMHACGHDSHTAVLLTVVKYFAEHPNDLTCRIKFLFTPAEEYTIPGCKELAENGVMDDVDCCLATHCSYKKDMGKMMLTPDPMGSNSLGFKVRFYGTSAHAASQEKGTDAILMAVEAITAMEFMCAKEIKVTDPRLLNIGSIHGGKTNNVVCDFVEIFGSCRTHSDEVLDYMEHRIQEICQGVALTAGGRAEYEHIKRMPYRINNAKLYEKAYETACRVIGEENILSQPVRMLGGEDFGYLTRKKPCLYTQFGSKPLGTEPVSPNHNARFILPNESMETPIRFFIQFVKDHMNGIEGL